MGGSVSLDLQQKYAKKGDNPYGIIQSKTFGSATASLPGSGNGNRIRYLQDPISALDFGATTVIPSLSQRWNNSAHSYSGLSIPDKIPVHDIIKNPLTPSAPDNESEILTE
eukprot:69790-Heterocapsa_arctica.AAC.1